jgi:FG-GAP-like repeat
LKRTPVTILLLCLAAAVAAQTTPTKPTTPTAAPKKPVAPPPKATPTPGILSRIDPDVVEETDTYVIRRYPKDKYIKTDDRHIKHPNLAQPVEFFKEDDKYYYISQPKMIPGEKELKESTRTTPGATTAPGARTADDPSKPLSVGVTAADFEDLLPPREAGRLKLERVAATGLPSSGQWRASFVTADVNGDKRADIVAPPSRIGDGKLHVWIGDGKGAFSAWPVSVTEGVKGERVSLDYGGVAVGDIDGDGQTDVVSASHGNGLLSAFGDGKGGFRVVRQGLPWKDFSAQAVVLLDANGDGRLDIVASRDSADIKPGTGVDMTQVRVYLFLGRDKGWEWKKDGLVGGFYSNSLHAWDYDGDGKKDVLTGSHYTGALTLLWKNAGDGTFSPVQFDAIEPYSYHFATAPGTFGKGRTPAYVDGYSMQANVPETARASGLSIYAFEKGAWTRHRVWRQKEWKAYLFGLEFGDLDRDGLDDLLFADNVVRKLRVLFQKPDGSFVEAAEADEPTLDSPGQTVRLTDVNGDGKPDVVVSKTVAVTDPTRPGGWDVYLNRR